MHKIDGPDATSDGRFQDENLPAGVLGTVLTAKWLNATQEELVGLIERAGLTPSDAESDQVLQALQVLYGSGAAGGALKNVLVNGSFELWQRGTTRSLGNALTYTADRWIMRADASGVGSGTATISRQDFAAGQTDVPGARNFLRWAQTVASTNGAPSMIQRVEHFERYSGRALAVSFYARAAANAACALRVVQDFGIGGNADVTVSVQSFTATTTWTRFSFLVTLPSLTGLTVGTNPNLRIALTFPNGSTYTVELADFQVELADQVTAYDRRPFALELLLAQRYYQKSYPLDVAPGTDGGVPADIFRGASSSRLAQFDVEADPEALRYEMGARFVVPMRATPTVAWYKPATSASAGTILLVGDSAGATIVMNVSATRDSADSHVGYPRAIKVSNPVLGPGLTSFGHWTADAEL